MTQERRKEARVKQGTGLTVSIQSAPGAGVMQGMEFTARSIDLSLRGLQLRSQVSVPVGVQLEIAMVFEKQGQSFSHTGQVMWCIECRDAGQEPYYKTGIALNELPEGPEFEAWRQAVLTLLASGN